MTTVTPLPPPPPAILDEMIGVLAGRIETDPAQASVRETAWRALLEARRRWGSLSEARAAAVRRAIVAADRGGAT